VTLGRRKGTAIPLGETLGMGCARWSDPGADERWRCGN
jgi:hypothetical protein